MPSAQTKKTFGGLFDKKKKGGCQVVCYLAFIYEKVSFKGMSCFIYDFIIGMKNEGIMFMKWKIREKKMNKLWTHVLCGF